MAATYTIHFTQNDGTPEGRTWVQRTSDIAATLEQYRHEEVPVIAAFYDADGTYDGGARAGGGHVTW